MCIAVVRRVCALLLCSALFLQGCGFQPATSDSSLSSTNSNRAGGRITVWSWNIAAKSLQSAVPSFRKLHPDVHVTVEMTGAQMQMRLMLSLVAGVGAPDICQLLLTDAPHYIATGRLTDLTQVANQYRTQFPQSVWKECMLRGHVYAIPWDIGPCAVYYRRSLFRRYGINPDKIKTWDDYIAAGEVVVQESHGRTKMLPLGSNDLQPMFELLLQQTGGQVFDDSGNVAIDSPQSLAALAIIKKMRTAGICSDVAAYSPEWMAGFSDSSIASYPGAVWLGGLIKDTVGVSSSEKGDWGVFRLPAVEPGGIRVANLGGSVLVIPAECPNKAAAWAFVKYALCTQQGQLGQYQKYDIFPGLVPALASPIMDEPDVFFGGQHVSRLFSEDVDKIPALNRTAQWAEANGYVEQALSHWAAANVSDRMMLASLSQTMQTRLDLLPSSTEGRAEKRLAKL